MIELTSGYTNSENPKLLLNKRYIIYVSECHLQNASYTGVNSYIEYGGGAEPQVLYAKETYEQIKALLTGSPGHASKPDAIECPECGSRDYIQICHEGNATVPDASFWICNDCGHTSKPE